MADVVLTIGGDSSGGQQAVKGVEDATSGLLAKLSDTDAIKGFGESLLSAFESPMSAISSLTSAISDGLLGALGDLGAAGEVAAGAIGGVAAAGAAVGGVLFGLTDHAAGAGEAVEAFSMKTGIAVQNVGPLQLAADAAGGSLDQLGGIAQRLELRMTATGPAADKFNAALSDMGINAAQFRGADFESELLMLSQGFQVASEKGNAMADGIAIGGRNMAASIPLIEKLNPDLLQTAAGFAMVWTPELIEQSRQFNTDLGLFEGALGTVATRIGAELLPVMSALVDTFVKSPTFVSGVVAVVDGLATGLGVATIAIGLLAKGTIDLMAPLVAVGTFVGTLLVQAVQGAVTWVEKAVTGIAAWAQSFGLLQTAGSVFTWLKDTVTTAVDWIVQKLESIPVIGGSIKTAFENASAAFTATTSAGSTLGGVADKLGASLLQVGTATATTSTNQLGLNKAHTDGAAAVTAFDKALADLESAGTNWHQTLLGIDGEVVAAVEYYLNAGVSANTLKEVYALTDVQIKALEDDHKDYIKTLQDVQKVEDAKNQNSMDWIKKLGDARQQASLTQMHDTVTSLDQTQQLWTQYYDTLEQRSMTTVQKQIADVQKWFDDEVLKLKDDDENWSQHYDALYAVAQAKMQGVYDAHNKMFQDSKKLLADFTDGPGGWVDTFSNILVHSGSFKDSIEGVWNLMKGDTLNIFSDLLAGIIHYFLDALLKEVEDYVAQMLVKLAVLKTISFFGALFGFSGGGIVPGGDAGGNDLNATSHVVYAADGLVVPQGTDTVPAMLTPGEGILDVADMDALGGPAGFNAFRSALQSGSLNSAAAGQGAVSVYIDASGSMFQDRRSLQDLANLVMQAINERVRTVSPLSLR